MKCLLWKFIGTRVAQYILLLRLRRAGCQLAFDRQAKVIDIALEAGFENPESFTRAFRNTFGKSPSTFRKPPVRESWHERYRFRVPERKQIVQVDSVDFKTDRVTDTYLPLK